MKVIILAAGQGTRLRPYTNDRPKCMVELHGKPLLHHQLDVMKDCGVSKSDIALVGGYLREKLVAPSIRQFFNPLYAETNMVETLFSAEEFMVEGEDLYIAYGDIVYRPNVFKSLMDSQGSISLTADQDWEKLWGLRMENPLDDAETFKLDDQGLVVGLGKKPESIADVDAQYMGLIKISGEKVADFKRFYHSLDRQGVYDGKDFKNMYMTSLLQSLIDSDWDVRACLISNWWL